jgi:hypothetical protein
VEFYHKLVKTADINRQGTKSAKGDEDAKERRHNSEIRSTNDERNPAAFAEI